jgi:hypothetical protein
MASKRIGQRRRNTTVDTLPAVGERHAFTAEIPGATPDRPAWRLKFEMITEAQGDGERVRFRVHLHSSIAEILAGLTQTPGHTALGHETASADAPSLGTALAPAYRLAGSALRLAMTVRRVRRLLAPLTRHNLDSWIEINASTADLADGADSLLPAIEQLKALGIQPPDASSPPVQSWAGPSGASGFAQVSLLRLDHRHLPAVLRSLLAAGGPGGAAFNLAGAVINRVEPAPLTRR